MANPYFVPGEQRGAKVNELFTTIAARYDLINDLQSFGLHRYWKWRMLKLINVQPVNKALDICCGTGDLALALARRGAETVGFAVLMPVTLTTVAAARLETNAVGVGREA